MRFTQTMFAMLLGLLLAWLNFALTLAKSTQPSALTVGDPNTASPLVADYQFRDSLASAVGNAPPLTQLGSSSFESAAVDDSSRRVLKFDPNGGVAVTPTQGLISHQSYTVVLLFSLSNTGGYRRLIDFKNGANDFGLYTYDGLVQFKRVSFTQGRNRVLVPNAVAQLALTRDAEGNVTVYVNGLRQISFVDNAGDAIISAGNTLRFFRDNTGDGESSAGFVARLRLYNSVLSGSEIAGLDRLPNAQADCPSISGISPNNGQPGATFAITGTSLSGVTAVSFPNGLMAPFTINNDTQLTVTVPSGAVTGTLALSKNSCDAVRTAAVYGVANNPPAALVADYQFQNNLESAAGFPPALLSLGNNTFETVTIDNRPRRALKFEPNNGVALFSTAGIIPAEAYTIVMLFSLNQTNGFRRLVDFKNGTSFAGLYTYDNLVQFQRAGFTQGRNRVILPNTMTQLALTRDTAGNVLVYVDGALQISFVDADSDALIEGQMLRFFRDNTGDGEAAGGYLARLRLFNRALSSNEIGALDRLPTGTVASVSAASFNGAILAPESIVAAFGSELATSTQAATTLPLPTSLAGTTVKIKDSLGIERLAPLFFVAPTQINYQIPLGVTGGTAFLTITSGDGVMATGTVQIQAVAPGLFSASASGQGVATGLVLRIKADGEQSFEPLVRFDAAQNSFVAVPIDLGPPSDQVFLILYGTGFRGRSSLAATMVRLGGVAAEVLYAGEAPGFVGLDQINVRAPRDLAGRGEVNVELVVDSKVANTVKLSFR